jgi:predicted metal-dependent hydrolase
MSEGAEAEAAPLAPAFSVSVSQRARHVRLVMSCEGQLIVVVPRRFDQRKIPIILESKRRWIERARARAAARRPMGPPTTSPPDRIYLPATGEEWEVEHRSPSVRTSPAPNQQPAMVRERPGRRLVVTASVDDRDACRRALLAWLHRRARRALVPRLEELADRYGMTVGRVMIRNQRSRWASCSRRGTISLNLRMLFLESALVDHILLHELCHTRELNHSPRFWALLQDHDPDCMIHRRQTRDAWRALPGWLGSAGAEQV